MKPIPNNIQTILAYCSFATLSSYSTSSKSHSVSSARHISNRKYDEKQWILVHNFSDIYRVWCGLFDAWVRYQIIYYWKLCSMIFISDFLYYNIHSFRIAKYRNGISFDLNEVNYSEYFAGNSRNVKVTRKNVKWYLNKSARKQGSKNKFSLSGYVQHLIETNCTCDTNTGLRLEP